jgi:methyltransferase (TIGR00027 family)
MRAGEPSLTARRVAAQRLSFPRVVTANGQPDVDQQLQADVASGITVSPTRMTRYLQARTAFFDRIVVESIDAGTDQAVVLGAGYDGRSLRYAKPGVRWFELDHPDTQTDKRARLRRLGIAASEITFVPADFALDDVAALLGQLGHDSSRATLFTCEGVAAYLSPRVLSSLLTATLRRAAPNSKLALELPLEPQSALERFRRSLLNAAVASMGEPLLSVIDGKKLDAFLAAHGWSVERAVDPSGVDIHESQRSVAFIVAAPAG